MLLLVDTSGTMEYLIKPDPATGANVLREDIAWASLELTGDGQYSPDYVAKMDRFMAGADARARPEGGVERRRLAVVLHPHLTLIGAEGRPRQRKRRHDGKRRRERCRCQGRSIFPQEATWRPRLEQARANRGSGASPG